MEKWARICLQKSSAKAEQKPKLVRQLLQSQIANLLSSGLSTCVEMLARPISIRSHNKTASKRRIREGRLWVDVLAARPAKNIPQSVIARLLNVNRLTVRHYIRTRKLQKPAP